MTPKRRPLRELRLLASFPFQADRRRTIIAFVLRPLSAAWVPLSAYLLKQIVDAVTAGDARRAIAAAMILGASHALLHLLQLTAWRVAIGLEDSILGHLQATLAETVASIPTLVPFESPDALDDLTIVRDQHLRFSRTLFKLPEGLAYIVGAASGIAMLVSIDPLLALLPLFGLPTIAAGYRGERHLRGAESAWAEPSRRATQLFSLVAAPDGAKEVRVYGVQDAVRRRQSSLWNFGANAFLRAGLRWSAWWSFGWFIFATGFAAAVVLITLRAAAGQATAGDVVMTITLASQLNGQVDLSVNLVVGLARAMRTAARMLRLIDLADDASSGVLTPVPGRLDDGVVLDTVSFRYPGSDMFALRDVSITFPAATTVALVGENGAGKTTLVKLLARLQDPTRGRLLIDGVDAAAFGHHEWQERIAAGFQDFAKLEFLVRESVGVGSLNEIERIDIVAGALDRAGGAGLTDRLPSGLETQLGRQWDDGVDLSEGQWQKVALGRTLMSRAPLVRIFDEPTSALDAQTEHELFEHIATATDAERATGTITVLVSHRFSTVRMADLIVVLDGGRVVEHGTHEELIVRDGLYAELYELQARSYR